MVPGNAPETGLQISADVMKQRAATAVMSTDKPSKVTASLSFSKIAGTLTVIVTATETGGVMKPAHSTSVEASY